MKICNSLDAIQNIFKEIDCSILVLKLPFIVLALTLATVSFTSLPYKVSAICLDTPVCENTGVGGNQENNCINNRSCLNSGDGSNQENNCISNFSVCSNNGDNSDQTNNCL